MKFVCPVCGYVEEFDGDELPVDFKCPQCGVSGDRFIKQSDTEMTWAAEHVVGVGKLPEVSEDIVNDLRANFEGECSEVGMYLAMARVAHREGYPEIGLYWEKAAYEEAEHAAKFAELLGEVVTDSTKKNLKCALKLKTAQLLARPILLSVLRLLVLMQFMTRFMRWLATKLAMARLLLVC